MLLIHFLRLIEDKVIYKRCRLRREIAQKCLGILFLSYNLHSFASDQIREESSKIYFLFFWSDFQQLCFQEATFDSFRGTFWEIAGNLWRALAIGKKKKEIEGEVKISRKFKI